MKNVTCNFSTNVTVKIAALILLLINNLFFSNVWAANNDYVRKASASAGEIGEVASTFLSSLTLVTAIKNSQGNLQLISWRVGDEGESIQRLASTSSGEVRQIQVLPLDHDNFVTAIITGDGHLKLIKWHADFATGQFQRLSEASAGMVRQVRIAALDYGRKLLTAVHDSSNNLKLISWDVDGNEHIHRLGENSAGQVTDIALTTGFYRDTSHEKLVTAIRDADGNLKLIAWQAFSNGQIERLGSVAAGNIQQVKSIDYYSNLLVTAVRDSNSNLKLISWVFDGLSFTRLDDASAGRVDDIEMTYSFPNNIITALRDADGNLLMIEWGLNANTSSGQFGRLTRLQTFAAGSVRDFSLANAGFGLITTAIRDRSNKLKIIAWDNCLDCFPTKFGHFNNQRNKEQAALYLKNLLDESIPSTDGEENKYQCHHAACLCEGADDCLEMIADGYSCSEFRCAGPSPALCICVF